MPFADICRRPGNTQSISSRGNDIKLKGARRSPPELRHKSQGGLFYINRNLLVFLGDEIMMSGISLVSGTGNNTHPRQHIQIIDHITERGFPFVISQIRTHANADHRLLAEISCLSQDIRNPAHDIVFLVTGRIAGNPVEFTVAALSLLTFDHHKLGEGRHA